MPSIDFLTLINWLVAGLIGFIFGSMSAWLAYRFQRLRDDIKWEREKEKLNQEFQHERELLQKEFENRLEELALRLKEKKSEHVRQDMLKGVDNFPESVKTLEKTRILLKFPSTTALEPRQGDTREIGRDLVFRWTSLGPLGPNECYQVTLQIINLADPLPLYVEASYLALSTCGSVRHAGTVEEFTLFAVGHGEPSYEKLVSCVTGSHDVKVRWWVTPVMMTSPKDTVPMAPSSSTLEFTLKRVKT